MKLEDINILNFIYCQCNKLNKPSFYFIVVIYQCIKYAQLSISYN